MDLIKDVAEPSRREILLALKSGPKCVSELIELTKLKQPNISNHLSKLRAKGVVTHSKIGRNVYYALAGAEIEEALVSLTQTVAVQEAAPVDLDEVAILYAKNAISGNENGCSKIIDQYIRQNVSLLQIYQGILAKSMELIGQWYEVKAIDVGQEHLASAITERMMARVVHYAPPVRTSNQMALIGCVAGNQHSIGARMVSDFVRLAGWRTVFLGANTPNDAFLTAIQAHHPQLVMISVSFSDDREIACELLQLLDSYRGGDFNYRIVLGGRQALTNPDVFLRAGADYTCGNLDEFAQVILPQLDRSTL